MLRVISFRTKRKRSDQQYSVEKEKEIFRLKVTVLSFRVSSRIIYFLIGVSPDPMLFKIRITSMYIKVSTNYLHISMVSSLIGIRNATVNIEK